MHNTWIKYVSLGCQVIGELSGLNQGAIERFDVLFVGCVCVLTVLDFIFYPAVLE